jgi:hypothetical protein
VNKETAQSLAERLYQGRSDLVGHPELDHPRRVAESVSPRAKAVAWLHDVVEDGLIERYELTQTDLSYDELYALELLNRNRGSLAGSTYMDYIREIATWDGLPGEIAREVKLADLNDNMTRDCPLELRDMRKPGGRYDRARAVLLEVGR